MHQEQSRMFRFPWTLTDNPIGWVEITDSCNIDCRGCYRRRMEGHKSLVEIEAEIRFMQRYRNVDQINLAGGEPLVHPQIVDIVRFIHDTGLKPCIISNGHRLRKPGLLESLKQAGLEHISFHVDSGQIRPGWTGKSEEELNALREFLSDKIHAAGGIKCGFNMTVTRSNLDHIPRMVRWALSRRGRVTGLTFIVLRGGVLREGYTYLALGKPVALPAAALGYLSDEATRREYVSATDVRDVLQQSFPRYQPAAYLGGSVRSESLKWIVAQTICSGNEMLGAAGPCAIELFQSGYHYLFGRYSLGTRRPFGLTAFGMALFDRGTRQALWHWVRRGLFFRRVYGLALAIVQPPDELPDGTFEMCDGCPDMTYFQGKLVHSCRLDEYRQFGSLLSQVPAQPVQTP